VGPHGARRAAAARRASPLLNVRAGLPPTVVLHGSADTVVPVQQAKDFQARMQAAGNRCEAVIYEGVSHAFVLLDYYPDDAVVVRAITDIDRFLAGLGYLTGPPDEAPTNITPRR
jgi:acetyl esterase